MGFGCFNLEQYCQLMLNYKLLVKKGGYLKTHSLRSLIRVLGEGSSELLRLVEDEVNLHYIARLEEKEVRDIHRFVVEVFKPLVEKV